MIDETAFKKEIVEIKKVVRNIETNANLFEGVTEQ